MNVDRLLGHYERIADAPEAVPRLRRFILDLAVRGKLVEQDPNDEPAAELLNRIAEEKARLVKAREFREPRNAVEIKRDELPFVPAVHWEWSRLIDIARASYGFAFQSSEFNTDKRGMPLIRIRDISKTDTVAYYEGDFDPTYLVRAGDYLVGMDGDFNLLRWQGLDGLLNQRVMRINGWRCDVDSEFVKLPLQMVLDYLHGATSLTTVKHLSAKQVNGIGIPLPPLAEQHRIVAKVDELMALCDRLEAARTEREATRDRLAAASLIRLNAPDPDPAIFRNQAAFALENLAPLTTRTDQIKALRQTILNLAVRGKLVEQDPNDEPAAELLGVISSTREEMVKASKAKRPKRLLPIADEDVLYDVPKSWSWEQANDLWDFENGDRSKNYPSRDQLVKRGIPFVNAGHLVNGRVSMFQMNFITPEKYQQLGGGKLKKGDQLYCLRGSLGKHAIYDHEGEGAIASSLVILRPIEQQCVPYLSIYLGSNIAGQMLRRFDNGSAQPNLSSANLRKYEIPLPPLAEQHRIVAKVNELMALCDRLEATLAIDDETRRRLLDALLYEALPARRFRGHLKKRKTRTSRAIRMAARG